MIATRACFDRDANVMQIMKRHFALLQVFRRSSFRRFLP